MSGKGFSRPSLIPQHICVKNEPDSEESLHRKQTMIVTLNRISDLLPADRTLYPQQQLVIGDDEDLSTG